MGNSATCVGPPPQLMATFPSFSSISSAEALQSDALAIQTTLTNYISLPASFIPGAGPFLAYLITFLGSTDFLDLNGAYIKAQIQESILENEIIHYKAEVQSIKNSLERLNRTDLTLIQLQPEITYALRRSEYLFELFKNRNHLLYKYPVPSMPNFIRIMNIVWATLQISTKLDPTFKLGNDVTLREMSELIRVYVDRFFEQRLNGITWYNCGFTIFSKQCLIYDRPWLKNPGAITNYYLTAYQFNLPLNENEWRDGIVIRTPNGCQPEKRDYPKLNKYKDDEEYKNTLKNQYYDYFRKVFPVEF